MIYLYYIHIYEVEGNIYFTALINSITKVLHRISLLNQIKNKYTFISKLFGLYEQTTNW